MTATCVLCGATINAVADLSILDEAKRNQKQFADIGLLAGEHLNKIHRKTVQTRFPEIDLLGPIPIPALIVAVGFCAQNSAVAAYLKCDDPVFAELNQKMAGVVRRAIEPVEVTRVLIETTTF